MIVVEFVQPDKALNANQQLHWADKARRVKAWRTAGCRWAEHYRVGCRPRSIVGISLPVRSLKVRRDGANWHPTLKAVIDGLVDAGVWPDDNGEWVVTAEPAFHQGGDMVRVTIEACG